MPQPSISYACGRVGVLGKSALSMAQLERLMATHTYEEARRALTDIGYLSGDMDAFSSGGGRACEKRLPTSAEGNAPTGVSTSCFQLRYDIHNLKCY